MGTPKWVVKLFFDYKIARRSRQGSRILLWNGFN
jgi:hypothetical protein